MRVDQKDNFYSFTCEEIGTRYKGRIVPGHANYTACQLVIRKVRLGQDHGMWPECRRAIENKTCPARKMLAEEFGNKPIYYVDRDDCGPGVIKRAQQGREPRTDEQIAFHHQLLANLGLEPWKPLVTKPVRAKTDSSPQSEAASSKPNRPAPKLSLGEMISAEAKEHISE